MKALKNRLILKADLDQKSTLRYRSLRLYMPPNQDRLTADGKVGNPVLAEVVGADKDYPHVKIGDVVLLNHNIINNKAFQALESEGSIVTLVIPIDRGILGKVSETGDIEPLCGNILAERMYEKPASSIIQTPDSYRKTEQNKVKVLAVSPEVLDVHAGDTAIVHKYSDYECWYTINSERHNAIIIWNVDVVGTL